MLKSWGYPARSPNHSTLLPAKTQKPGPLRRGEGGRVLGSGLFYSFCQDGEVFLNGFRATKEEKLSGDFVFNVSIKSHSIMPLCSNTMLWYYKVETMFILWLVIILVNPARDSVMISKFLWMFDNISPFLCSQWVFLFSPPIFPSILSQSFQ